MTKTRRLCYDCGHTDEYDQDGTGPAPCSNCGSRTYLVARAPETIEVHRHPDIDLGELQAGERIAIELIDGKWQMVAKLVEPVVVVDVSPDRSVSIQPAAVAGYCLPVGLETEEPPAEALAKSHAGYTNHEPDERPGLNGHFLVCPNCSARIDDESQYEFLDVSEGLDGSDVIRLRCLACNQEGLSLAYRLPAL